MNRSRGDIKTEVCPVCLKVYIPAPLHSYAYKKQRVCSWGCVCRSERQNEKREGVKA